MWQSSIISCLQIRGVELARVNNDEIMMRMMMKMIMGMKMGIDRKGKMNKKIDI